MNTHFVSVVCPVYNEEKFIANCINSIIRQDYPKEYMEVFLVDGMSSDLTRSIIMDYVNRYSFIHLLDNPDKIVPHALNIGIRKAKGDVLIRIDGHCTYPVNYISVLVRNLYELGADNVGAVWNTLPAKNTSLCKAIAVGVSHKFGIGNSLHKVGVKDITETDTVPFGCFRKDIFDRIGEFDEELIRNQDDEFNARIIKNGGKIYLIPDLVIDYYARDSIYKVSKMFYQYGLFKPLVNKKLGFPATLRQFFPLLFVVGLILGGLLSLFLLSVRYIYVVVLLLYLLISLSFSLIESLKHKDWRLLFFLPWIFLVIHISYGWGYLHGIYKILKRESFCVHSNR